MEAKGPAGAAAVSRQGGDGGVCLRLGVARSSIHNYTEASEKCWQTRLHVNKDQCLQPHEMCISDSRSVHVLKKTHH